MNRRTGHPGEHARRLLAEHHVTAPPVTALDAIAAQLGVQLVRNHAPGHTEAGFVYADRHYKIIGVNSATSACQERFAVAHLIGHYLMHPHRTLTVCHTAYTSPPHPGMATLAEEQQAHQFAFDLLIPEALLIEATGKPIGGPAGCPDEAAAALAATFQVSTQAMTARLIGVALILPG